MGEWRTFQSTVFFLAESKGSDIRVWLTTGACCQLCKQVQEVTMLLAHGGRCYRARYLMKEKEPLLYVLGILCSIYLLHTSNTCLGSKRSTTQRTIRPPQDTLSGKPFEAHNYGHSDESNLQSQFSRHLLCI